MAGRQSIVTGGGFDFAAQDAIEKFIRNPSRRANNKETMRRQTLRLLLAVSMALPVSALAAPTIVVDVKTGAVLSHSEAFQRWYPASITKLMTIYMAFKAVREGKLSMKSPVVITKAAAAEPPSKMGYKVGTVLTLDNALKMLMVKSANDIAVAVAGAISGSEMEFVHQMNEAARALGMTDTRFANPHGLPDKGQYTTARDLALLAVVLRRQFPEYANVFNIEALKAGEGIIRNYNILIGRFAGADGMKTGFVCASGFNLAASATREGRTLVAIVLGATSQEERAETAADLLADGFARDPANFPPLESLTPYGEGREQVRDIRAKICTKDAADNRYDGRDVDGHLVFRSPHLSAMARAPVAVPVGPGGADGPAAANTVVASIPLPTFRPADAPAPVTPAPEKAAASAPDTGLELRGTPAPGVPVPTFRPSI